MEKHCSPLVRLVSFLHLSPPVASFPRFPPGESIRILLQGRFLSFFATALFTTALELARCIFSVTGLARDSRSARARLRFQSRLEGLRWYISPPPPFPSSFTASSARGILYEQASTGWGFKDFWMWEFGENSNVSKRFAILRLDWCWRVAIKFLRFFFHVHWAFVFVNSTSKSVFNESRENTEQESLENRSLKNTLRGARVDGF